MGKLQANFWVNNLISLLNADSSEKVLKPLICESCDCGDAAVSRCTECSLFMCDLCGKAHQEKCTMKHHQIVSLQEANSSLPNALAKAVHCDKHRGEILKLFCQTCDKPICCSCTVYDHQGHMYLFATDAAAKEKEAVKQLLEKTRAKVPVLSTGVESVEEMEKRVQAKVASVTQDIEDLKNKQVRALEEAFANLKHEAKSIGQAKVKQLEAQREGLMIALASVSNSVEFTERALKDGSDVEVLSMKKQMVSNLSKLSSSSWECKPCQEDAFQLQVHKDICQMAGSIASVDNIHMCTVSMVGGEPGVMDYTLAGQGREFTVVLRDNLGNQRVAGGDDVDVSVVPPGASEGIVVKVTDNKNGTYRFGLQPKKHGTYQLIVAVSDQQINGSPFQWNVLPKQSRQTLANLRK